MSGNQERKSSNKEEAIVSKVLAEIRFMERDYVAAKKFAYKAKDLYSDLDGLSQFIYAVDVHVVAQKKQRNGERDWYGILAVEPLVDEETITKQFRKLAFLLHPDRNKALGAEDAFKYICEAWRVLSDKKTKADYDARCGVEERHSSDTPQQQNFGAKGQPQQRSRAKTRSTPSSASFPANIPPFEKNVLLQHTQTVLERPSMPASSSRNYSPSQRFWTSCHSCKMFLEYERSYLMKQLCCPVCYKSFVATEVAKIAGALMWESPSKHSSDRTDPLADGLGVPVAGKSSPREKLDAGNAFHDLPSYRNKLRNKSEGFVSSKRKKQIKSKQKKSAIWESKASDEGHTNSITVFKGASKRADCNGQANPAPVGKKNLRARRSPNPGHHKANKHKRVRISLDRSKQDLNFSFKMAKGDVKSSCNDVKSSFNGVDNSKAKATCKRSHSQPMKCHGSVNLDSVNAHANTPSETETNTSSVINVFTVPDSDFHHFGKDRKFAPGQVWAVYDDQDSMPRYYARIDSVKSWEPLRMLISWLEPWLSSDENCMSLYSGFSQACGEFKIGEQTETYSDDIYSHLMSFEKVRRGPFKIYPRKGEIWALYKNCEKSKAVNVKHEFMAVEIVDDYEEDGVMISHLVKVDSYKTTFTRQTHVQHFEWICRSEICRFSHQIPSYHLKSDEIPNINQDCWDLDPASIPFGIVS